MSTFNPTKSGVCVNCGRKIGWHAGTRCFPVTTSGMPKGIVLPVRKGS